MSRVWMWIDVGGLLDDVTGIGRRVVPFIGVVRLMVFVDIHYELEASHDGMGNRYPSNWKYP